MVLQRMLASGRLGRCRCAAGRLVDRPAPGTHADAADAPSRAPAGGAEGGASDGEAHAVSAARASPRSAAPYSRVRRLSPHGFLGADRLGRQLRPHVLRRQGAGRRDRVLRLLHGQSVSAARRIRAEADRDATAERDEQRRRHRRRDAALPRICCGRRSKTLRPAYIYERLCLGNSAAALLSAEFGVPYIVEYNGSEISMRRSFEDTGYVYEAEYLEAEALAFEQATMISVVSGGNPEHAGRARRRPGEDPGQPERRRSRRVRAGVARTSANRSGRAWASAPPTAWSVSPARSAAGTASTC